MSACPSLWVEKSPVKGSGLGLSMVLGVAQQSGGDVRIRSRAGERTSIEVYLPRTPNMASSERVAAAAIDRCDVERSPE